MGYNVYSTQTLVDNILMVAHVPTGNNTFTSSNLVTLANRELQLPIMKQILSTQGGYYLTYADLTNNTLGEYDLPADAIAGALANVELVQNTTIIQCNPIEESEQFSTNSCTSTSYGYFFRGNTVKILPTPNVGTARLWYLRRPSQLVTTDACGQVTGVAGTVISVSSVPSTFAVGGYLDAVGDQPPFNVVGDNLLISAISGTDITVDQDLSATLSIGDWMCLHKQTCIPQIPVEFRTLLEQRVVVKIYETQGYLDKLKVAQESLKELEAACFSLITPRVQGKTKVIFPSQGGFLVGNGSRFSNYQAGRDT